MNKPNKKVIHAWVKALRSGKWRQGTGGLRGNKGGGLRYCCMGVLCDLHANAHGRRWNRSRYLGHCGFLPKAVSDWAGLESEDPVINVGGGDRHCSEANDGGIEFEHIAAALEKKYLKPKARKKKL